VTSPSSTTGTTRTLAVVSAGLGQPSSTRLLADQLAAAAERSVRERGDDVITTTVDLRDLAHDITDNLLTGFPSQALQAVVDGVRGSDGLIAVTPIYNASYGGLFKSFFDVLDDDSLDAKPTVLAATGGTARHSLALDHALRPLFAYLRAAVVPTAVFAATEDWAAPAPASPGCAGASTGPVASSPRPWRGDPPRVPPTPSPTRRRSSSCCPAADR
jgi:FMN reductase